ncbi:MAG: MMPL family transporter [Planctomycetota bacterium]
MTRFIALAVRRPRTTILFFLVLAGIAGTQLPRLVTDNSLERWLEGDAAALALYRDFLERFGHEEFLGVALVADDPLAPAVLESVEQLTTALRSISGVQSVLSLSALGREMPGSSWPPGEVARERLREFARDSHLCRGMILARSEHGTTILAQVDPRVISRPELVERVERLLAETPLAPAIKKSFLVGPPVINVALDHASREGLRQFMPVIIGVVVAVSWLLLGSPLLVVACLAPALTSVLIIFGIYVTAGLTQDMITSMLAPLVFILTMSGAIHAVSHHRQCLSQGMHGEEALITALRGIARPLLFINLTTTVGLLALLTSSVSEMRTLGLMAALGVGLGHAVELLLGGAILALFRERLERTIARSSNGTLVTRCLLGLQRAAGAPAVVLGVIVLVAGAWAAPKLPVDSRMLEHFPEAAPIRIASEYFNEEYAGLAPLEVVLTFPHPVDPRDGATLEKIAAVEKFLQDAGGLERTFSVASLQDDIELLRARAGGVWGEVPANVAWAVALEQGPAWLRDLVGHHLSGNVARISTLSRELSSTVLEARVHALSDHLTQAFPELSVRLTGFVPILVGMQQRLIESQFRSFALALACISVLFLVLFRSVGFALLAMIPNLLPLAAASLLLYWWGEPLNVATVMIASLAMGMAVDNTIHFCVAYRDERGRGRSPRESVENATRHTGRAIATATAVISLGFLSLVFASYRMIAIFGFLVSLVMLGAFASAVLVLPSILRRSGRTAGAFQGAPELCPEEIR